MLKQKKILQYKKIGDAINLKRIKGKWNPKFVQDKKGFKKFCRSPKGSEPSNYK